MRAVTNYEPFALLEALDDDDYYAMRDEDGTWTVCDAEMGVCVQGLDTASDAAAWIIDARVPR